MNSEYNWKKYCVIYICALIAAILIIAAINLLVDPHGRFLLVNQPGFNLDKPTVGNLGRVGKTFALRSCKFNQIVIGSSRSELGINPNSSLIGPGPGFNAALPGTNVYETRRVVEYFSHWQTPSTVWYGIDFPNFNYVLGDMGDFSESQLADKQEASSLFVYLVSIETLQNSFFTILANLNPKRVMCDLDGHTDMQHRLAFQDQHISTGTEFRRVMQDYITQPYLYAGFDFETERLDEFTAILQSLIDKNVNIVLFLSPVHAMQLELLTEMGLLNAFEQWKRDLVSTVNELNKGLPDDRKLILWDFTGYHSYATEPVPEEGSREKMFGFIDSSHYRSELGNLVIRRISGDASSGEPIANDFGRQLNDSTIESIFSEFRIGQQKYRAEHPEALAKLRRLVEEGPVDDAAENQLQQPLFLQ